jgi:hypothetical protein
LNLRPSGYEPDELPDCSTPRRSGDRGQRSAVGPERSGGFRAASREQAPGLQGGRAKPARGFRGRAQKGSGGGARAGPLVRVPFASIACGACRRVNASPGLATTRSPTLRRAVPWAQCGFTAEFGMGSGGTRTL